MSEAIYIATSGAIAQEMRLEMISNNLSNIGTTGFKEDQSLFKALLAGSEKDFQDQDRNSENEMINTKYFPSNYHVKLIASRTNYSQGLIRKTGNILDFALNGDGFFEVRTPLGIRYSRNGNFKLSKDGMLVTQDGNSVMGRNGEIKIDGRDITVDLEGNISVDGKQVGSLKIVDFEKPYKLDKVGENYFVINDENNMEKTNENTEIKQGYLELSNVDAVKSLTEMIEVLRAYESYQKAIQSIDEMTSKAINEVGRLV